MPWIELQNKAEKATKKQEAGSVKDEALEKVKEVASKVETAAPPGTKVKPNDPCPCGNGKKWKKCCGPQRQ